jgi:hypothetical protein
MKTMICKDLAGACEVEFRAETFDEMAELSRKHGMEMAEKGDKAHIEAMQKMSELMSDPEAMKQMMEGFQNDFDSIPEDK